MVVFHSKLLNNQRVGAGLGRRIMAKETNLMEKLPEVRGLVRLRRRRVSG